MTEDEMVGWHHWLNGHEFEQALGKGEGQGILACSSPWGCQQSDTTEQLKSSERPEDTKHVVRGGWTDETTFDGQKFNPLLPLDSLNDNNLFYIPQTQDWRMSSLGKAKHTDTDTHTHTHGRSIAIHTWASPHDKADFHLNTEHWGSHRSSRLHFCDLIFRMNPYQE